MYSPHWINLSFPTSPPLPAHPSTSHPLSPLYPIGDGGKRKKESDIIPPPSPPFSLTKPILCHFPACAKWCHVRLHWIYNLLYQFMWTKAAQLPLYTCWSNGADGEPLEPFHRVNKWEDNGLYEMWHIKKNKKNKWQFAVKRTSCSPILSLSTAPSSLTPIHNGYCQGSDRDHCAPSFYSLEDMRQKKWQTHVKVYWRKQLPNKMQLHSLCQSLLGQKNSHLNLHSEDVLHGRAERRICEWSRRIRWHDIWTVMVD